MFTYAPFQLTFLFGSVPRISNLTAASTILDTITAKDESIHRLIQ